MEYDIKIRRLVVLLLWLMLLLPATLMAAPSAEEMAEARWFQVEIIVFEHLNKAGKKSEDWTELVGISLAEENPTDLNFPEPEPPTIEPVIIRPLVDPTIGQIGITKVPNPAFVPPAEKTGDVWSWLPKPFEILAAHEMQLGKAVKSLRRSKGFRPLLHVAWRQPTFEQAKAQAILIHDKVTEPPPVEEDATLEENRLGINYSVEPTGPATGAPEKAEPEFLEPEVLSFFPAPAKTPTEEDLAIGPLHPLFVGTVKLSVSRYLHLDTNLIYRAATQQQEAIRVPDYILWGLQPYPTLQEPQGPAYQMEAWQAIRGFQLKESRRMRSTEVHYLDHPLFGMVVLVTPYELPAPPPTEIRLDPKNVL